MNKTIAILLTLSLFGCQSQQTAERVDVQIHGKLKEIMMQNQLQSRIDLNEIELNSKRYGLGALAGLEGEIMILEGKPFISKAIEGQVLMESSRDYGAALLVSSEVEEWTTTNLKSLSDLGSLEKLIEEKAKEENLKTEGIIPFMIKGKINRIEWHIINAVEATEASHEAYKSSGKEDVSKSEEVEILGFFSKKHEGVFTHHGSFLHLHFINKNRTIMAHVDELMSQNEAQLFLPKSLKQ